VPGPDFEHREDANRGRVVPLGVFGVLAGQRDMERVREDLRVLSGEIPSPQRVRIANYLRTCPIVIALMEHTRDVLEGAFGVPGGSAIHTDGIYYWRRDAAEYVAHYGIQLPGEFLERGDNLSWLPPSLSEEQVLDIDDYLVGHICRLAPDK
jgi:hypothetical protein